MNMSLIDKLKSWDGVHVSYLTELYNSFSSSTEFFKNVINICKNNPELHIPATWLVKHHYDQGNSLPYLLTEEYLKECANFNVWEAKLHLLQVFPHFNLSDNSVVLMEDFVRDCLTDKKKFVKAWAYNGLFALTKYNPELVTEVEFICNKAMQTESAAIKAKVRKILKAINSKSS